MENGNENIYKNTVGGSINEIKKKRKMLIFIAAILVIVIVSVVFLLGFNVNHAMRKSASSKLRTEKKKLETTKTVKTEAEDSSSNLKLYCVANMGDSESEKITTVSLNKEFYCYTDDENGIKMEADEGGLASGYNSSLLTVTGDYWIRLKYTSSGIKTINVSSGNMMTKVSINVTSDNSDEVKTTTNTTTTKTTSKITTNTIKTTTKTTFKTTTKTTTKATTAANSKIISNVISFNQYPNYPAGCEPISLYIILKYYGVNVTADDVMNAVPTCDTPVVNGYGADPDECFLGNPRSEYGWGIYPGGLKIAADKLKKGIINGTGMEFSEIYKLIDSNRPVIVWTTVNLQNPRGPRYWHTTNGKEIEWISPNHAVVVIGYDNDKNTITISDPIDGTIKSFDKTKFIEVYNIKGKKALYYK